jgi:hypothetical protein
VKEMPFEQMVTQILAGMLANPSTDELTPEDLVATAIRFAHEIRNQTASIR